MEMVSPASWYFAAARNESLIRCLQATKEYFDRYLLLTSDDLSSLNITDFIPNIYAVLILGAFAAGAYNSPSLDVASIKQTANLDYYLDALSAQALQVLAVSPPGSNTYMSHVYDLFQQSKIWYAQLAKDPNPVGIITGRPTFSFMEIIPTIMARCVDMSKFGSESDISSGVDSRLSEIGSDVQWSEMLSNWAASQDLSNMVLDTAMG
jgi:hypothetical protein